MQVIHNSLFQFLQELRKQLLAKQWEKALPPPAAKVHCVKVQCEIIPVLIGQEYVSSMQSGIRTGIMGIERNIEKKQRETGKEVSQVSWLTGGLVWHS